jgi:hypothetical protein
MEGFLIFILILCALFIYFLPSVVGWNKRNSESIIAINFFLGWTFVGWVVCLAWALMSDYNRSPPLIQRITQVPKDEDKFDKLKKLKELLDNGVLSDDEYKVEKYKILQQGANVLPPGSEIDLKP